VFIALGMDVQFGLRRRESGVVGIGVEALASGSSQVQGQSAEEGGVAALLNRLFATIYPPDRGRFTSQELIQWLERGGMSLSAPYLSQLRTGQRRRPSPEVIELIAEFFGIRADYFTDSDYRQALDAELDWLDLARNPDVRRLTSLLLELDADSREQFLSACGV